MLHETVVWGESVCVKPWRNAESPEVQRLKCRRVIIVLMSLRFGESGRPWAVAGLAPSEQAHERRILHTSAPGLVSPVPRFWWWSFSRVLKLLKLLKLPRPPEKAARRAGRWSETESATYGWWSARAEGTSHVQDRTQHHTIISPKLDSHMRVYARMQVYCVKQHQQPKRRIKRHMCANVVLYSRIFVSELFLKIPLYTVTLSHTHTQICLKYHFVTCRFFH